MASTRLTRSISSTGSRQKFTYSAWIKRGTLPSSEIFFANKVNSTTYAYLRFTNDELRWMDYDGGANSNLITNRVFRDTSSWYHIVFAFDTTLGSGETNKEERTKLYINGVRETSFRVASYAGHNQDSAVNVSGGTAIHGCNQDQNSDFFTGSMSHIHFIDGTAYDASAFGETDSTTGEWKAKTSPSVTYGTNGFFILKDGNSVTDQSGKGNNFTVSGGTLTDLKDNPDNVFATWNPLWRSRFDNDGAFVNGNTKVTFQNGDSNRGYGISTIGVTKGKYYWEVKQITDDQEFIGVADANFIAGLSDTFNTQNPSRAIGMKGTNGNLYYNTTSNSSYHNTNVPANAIISIALDMDNYLMWYGINGTWLNNATASEIANGTATNDVTTAIGTKNIINNGEPIFPMVECESVSGQAGFEANFGNGFFGTTAITTNSGNGYSGAEGSSKFNYTVPTGYSALNTKGLNN